jgi:SSS family solute:Na+ symporter
MFLLGILWKRTTHAAALTVAVLTIPLSLALERLYPGLPFHNRTGIVFWTCMLVCVVVSLLTKPKPVAELDGLIWNAQSLRLPHDERHARPAWQRPGFWWSIVTALTLFFYIRYA